MPSAKTNADTGSTDWTLVEETRGKVGKKGSFGRCVALRRGNGTGVRSGPLSIGIGATRVINYDGGGWTSLNRQACYVICVTYKRPKLPASIRRRLVFSSLNGIRSSRSMLDWG
jgi:hypothetical protein